MANLILRSSTNQPLTFAELDGNFEYFTGSHSVTGSITATQGFIGNLAGTASYTATASYAMNAENIFLRNQTRANLTESVVSHQSIFNAFDLSILNTSIFIIDSTSEYYVLGDLFNSGSIVVNGTLKIGGALYNSGSITGTGIII